MGARKVIAASISQHYTHDQRKLCQQLLHAEGAADAQELLSRMRLSGNRTA